LRDVLWNEHGREQIDVEISKRYAKITIKTRRLKDLLFWVKSKNFKEDLSSALRKNKFYMDFDVDVTQAMRLDDSNCAGYAFIAEPCGGPPLKVPKWVKVRDAFKTTYYKMWRLEREGRFHEQKLFGATAWSK